MFNLKQIFRPVLALIAVLLVSCSSTPLVNIEYLREDVTKEPEKVIPKTKLSTNAMQIEKALQTLTIPEEITSKINLRDKIILCSIERFGHLDNDIQQVIDRNLFKKLNLGGFAVLERDNHILFPLLIEKAAAAGKSVKISASSDTILTEGLLTGATKIIGYRVIEAGVLFNKNSSEQDYSRKTSIELEMRVVDVSNSQILALDIAKNEIIDKLTSDEKSNLGNYQYKFENRNLPLVNRVDAGEKLIVDKEVSAKFSELKGRVTAVRMVFPKNSDKTEEVKIMAVNSLTVLRTLIIPPSGIVDWDLKDTSGNPVKERNLMLKWGSKIRVLDFND